MAVTPASFKLRYPEFDEADDALITLWLADAVKRVDAAAWEDKEDDGVALTTAMLGAQAPFGQQARLLDDDGESIYSKALVKRQKSVACGRGRII